MEELFGASVQYLGVNGLTQSCLEGIAFLADMMETADDSIRRVGLLVTDKWRARHLFVLRDWNNSFTVIRSGFSSGYPGEGPKGLSLALCLLYFHRYVIREVLVPPWRFNRINGCATYDQIKGLFHLKPREPAQNYHLPQHRGMYTREKLAQAIHEHYDVDLKWLHEDVVRVIEPGLRKKVTTALREGYILLEEKLQALSGVEANGAVRMSDLAFDPNSCRLRYSADDGEQRALMRLFMGAFGLFRNETAHALDSRLNHDDQVRAIHLLDLLYRILLRCEPVNQEPRQPQV